MLSTKSPSTSTHLYECVPTEEVVASVAAAVLVEVIVVVVETSVATTMPRQKGDSRMRLVVVVVVVMVVVVVVVVSASATTTMPQRKKKRGGHLSTGVLSLHEGGHSTTARGVLFLRSGVIFLRRIMTRVIPLRSKMTRGVIL